MDQNILKKLLKFCEYNEQGILVTNQFYDARHKVRHKGQYITLKALYFLYRYGHLPHGKLIDDTREHRIIDCDHLRYERHGV